MSLDINLSYVKEMLDDDPEQVKVFVADIISQIKETELQLQDLMQQRNFPGISAAAHKIKSVYQMVGAEQLYQKIHELEITAKKADDIGQIHALCESVEKLSVDCRERLEEII